MSVKKGRGLAEGIPVLFSLRSWVPDFRKEAVFLTVSWPKG